MLDIKIQEKSDEMFERYFDNPLQKKKCLTVLKLVVFDDGGWVDDDDDERLKEGRGKRSLFVTSCYCNPNDNVEEATELQKRTIFIFYDGGGDNDSD